LVKSSDSGSFTVNDGFIDMYGVPLRKGVFFAVGYTKFVVIKPNGEAPMITL